MSEAISLTAAGCLHCGNVIPRFRMDRFCCRGCETVFTLLQSRGWEKYYDLHRETVSLGQRTPAPEVASEGEYDYLDDPEFRKNYGTPESGELRFYLEGVHCVACIWLVEKAGTLLPGVRGVNLNLGTSVATVSLDAQTRVSPIANEFRRLGYTPHMIREGEEEGHRAREDRRTLIRLGVAGAATGNLMLLAVSLYAGANEPWATIFRWISFGVFLPVFFFCAVPFYKSAWSALQIRQISIDVPIVLGIALGTLSSVINLFTGSEHIYFDSLAALVFLLLASRYVLRKSQALALSHRYLGQFLAPSRVRFRIGAQGPFLETNIDAVKPGHWVQIVAGETIPMDGIVMAGKSAVDVSLLTGESTGLIVEPGSAVFAGTVNQDGPLEIQVTASGSGTRLGKIMRETADFRKRRAPIAITADRVARWFVGVVAVAVCVGVLVGWRMGWQDGLDRALALALVTCPCALALATPLSFLLTIGRFAKKGILIKGDDTLERLSRVRTVFFDKTGTLTYGRYEVRSFVLVGDSTSEERARLGAIALALELGSRHPIALAIQRYFSAVSVESIGARLPEVTDFREQIGKGVSGRVNSKAYALVRSERAGSDEATWVDLVEEGRVCGRFSLGDEIREDAKAAIHRLHALGVDVRILSGDSKGAVEKVADHLGIDRSKAYAGVDPEGKAAMIRQHPQAMMIGDGANDSVALAAAYVGVAAHGGVELSLKAADIYQARPGVSSVADLWVGSRETMRVVRRGFAFSLAYNLFGGVMATLGQIDPLSAAVLMPTSALTVFISVQVGTRGLRKIWRRP